MQGHRRDEFSCTLSNNQSIQERILKDIESMTQDIDNVKEKTELKTAIISHLSHEYRHPEDESRCAVEKFYNDK